MSPEEKNALEAFLRKEFSALSLAHEAKWVFEEIQNFDSCTANDKAEEIILRRKKGEPLAYILGHWDFRRLRLSVGKGVLIPRPETEELVEHVLEYVKNHSVNTVADFGAGSGAIALAIADETSVQNICAVEKSLEAFEYLEKNLQTLSAEKQKRVHLINSDWKNAELPKLDLIVSNPPYVSSSEYFTLDKSVAIFEPKSALLPENESDPMSDYKSILEVAQKKLKAGGALFFEFGPAQEGNWEPLMRDFSYKIFKDLSGKPRILYAFDFRPKSR